MRRDRCDVAVAVSIEMARIPLIAHGAGGGEDFPPPLGRPPAAAQRLPGEVERATKKGSAAISQTRALEDELGGGRGVGEGMPPVEFCA